MDLRNRLRDETKESHQQLDRSVGTLGVLETKTGYAVYLSCLHQLYGVYADQIDWASDQAGIARCVEPLQAAIEDDLSMAGLDQSFLRGPNWSRSRSYDHHIDRNDERTADERAFDERAFDGESPRPKPCWPESCWHESCWAAAYVLEGSAMGARYMLKQAETTPLVARGEIQISYLTRLAEESYQRWPAFIAALEKAECDPDTTVTEAQNVFKTAANIFAKAISHHNEGTPEIK